ncbi:Myb-like DNA-binding domain protein (macronuclear) [Tetrahymena thermophila SB210]|uniref:Myb-like DNA-binding domain protein n=1 Tax=Tetrahymena thermophila (strain SB210) TaxID=312017 RepID=I7MG59_TETTS|nr:Myb-like DNA-binding domain protein [Tetrahymena thermophila SB210]EAS01126.3 Myb-like DNA-binding domain protein [Tetrahymena thermophila SB210]|eukprot:XP_001021371.3 Myb-like DNA-binding domain protein [Tetrahymena thermophila SB210]
MKAYQKLQQINLIEATLAQEYPDFDIEQISQMAKKVVEQFSGVRQKSKSIKKDTSVCSSSTNNTYLKNANSLQNTLNSTQASQINTSSNQTSNNQNANINNNNNLSISSSTTASISSIQKRVKFTPQEDEIILKYVQKHGKKWSEISKRLPGRTEVMVRNRYYVKIRKLSKEKDNCTGDYNQIDEAGLFNAENSSLDLNNEQASDLFLGNSQSAISKNQSTNLQQQLSLKDEKQRSDQFEIQGSPDTHFLQDSNNFSSLNYHNLHDAEMIFDSPVKQSIFEEHGLLHFNQHNANLKITSMHNFDEQIHNYQNKDQHLFDSAVKDFPQNNQNSNFYEHAHLNSNINQNSDFYDKSALLQNQQCTQLPFQNGIGAFALHQEEDDFFEEANKPFKLPKIYLPEDDLNDISSLLPPVGQMEFNGLNNANSININNNIINSNNNNATQIDSTKQEKIQFLQNQISMIENMLNMCKDEIIREFAQRKSVSTNADVSNSSATPFQQLEIVKNEDCTDQQQQDDIFNRLQSFENQHQFANTSMELEDVSNKNQYVFEHDGHELNIAENFNYHLNEQNQMITSLNNF